MRRHQLWGNCFSPCLLSHGNVPWVTNGELSCAHEFSEEDFHSYTASENYKKEYNEDNLRFLILWWIDQSTTVVDWSIHNCGRDHISNFLHVILLLFTIVDWNYSMPIHNCCGLNKFRKWNHCGLETFKVKTIVDWIYSMPIHHG